MYEFLKKTAKTLLPADLLKKSEPLLRNIVALRYRGEQYTCNVCDFNLREFLQLSNGEQLCPRCGSLPRTRRLLHLLESEVGIAGKDILHFSPPRAFAKKIKKENPGKYVTSDYMGEFEADKQLDITNITEPKDSYDLIICYHVLEHIEEDQKAMEELYRILKPKGICLIQTPFKSGNIYEDANITSPEEREKHFGQNDHVRIYSVAGLVARLKKAGFETEVRSFEEGLKYGLKKGELVLTGKSAKG